MLEYQLRQSRREPQGQHIDNILAGLVFEGNAQVSQANHSQGYHTFLSFHTMRPLLIGFRRAVCTGRVSHPVTAFAPFIAHSFSIRSLSDFGDSKPDAATDLSSSNQDKASSKAAPVPDIDASRYTVSVEVKMPAMGDGGGKILKWYKQKGDVVLREDVLCDIETDDFTFGMETDDEHPAIMGDILVDAPSGKVKDDEVLCILLHEEPKSKKEKEKKE